MASNHSPFAAVIAKLNHLQSERDRLHSRIIEIDQQVATIATQLGMSVNEVAPVPLEAPKIVKPDGRTANTMSSYALDRLMEMDRGVTRKELREMVQENTSYADQIKRNPNGFYNMVVRLLRTDRVMEVDGHLYHAARAPIRDNDLARQIENDSVVPFGPPQRKLEI